MANTAPLCMVSEHQMFVCLFVSSLLLTSVVFEEYVASGTHQKAEKFYSRCDVSETSGKNFWICDDICYSIAERKPRPKPRPSIGTTFELFELFDIFELSELSNLQQDFLDVTLVERSVEP